MEQKERYWTEVEENYPYRKMALEWMKQLPKDKAGTIRFLNGLETEYIKAFVLSVTVYSPLKFKVRWYDNTESEVELYSNVDEGRCLK